MEVDVLQADLLLQQQLRPERREEIRVVAQAEVEPSAVIVHAATTSNLSNIPIKDEQQSIAWLYLPLAHLWGDPVRDVVQGADRGDAVAADALPDLADDLARAAGRHKLLLEIVDGKLQRVVAVLPSQAIRQNGGVLTMRFRLFGKE